MPVGERIPGPFQYGACRNRHRRGTVSGEPDRLSRRPSGKGASMSSKFCDRRRFLATAVSAAAGAAFLGGEGVGAPKNEQEKNQQKILNYNPKMGYRRLGKTGLMISEVSLGGHGAGGYGPEHVANRAAVLSRAIELGINYVDTNIAEECKLYGKAMGKKRDRWYIGFASWPQKLTPDWEENLTKAGIIREIENRLRDYHTDCLDIWRPVGATWGKGQRNIATMYTVSRRVLDMVVEVFEKVHRQGKVRFLGISAHNPKVFRLVLNEYPTFSVIIFPYLFLTEIAGGGSLLELAERKNVGVIGLKPFGAGTTFGIKPRQIHGRVDPRAHLLVKKMLQEPRISAIIPGVNIPEQLEENVRGSYMRRSAVETGELPGALRSCKRSYLANLTPEYRWLRLWERV